MKINALCPLVNGTLYYYIRVQWHTFFFQTSFLRIDLYSLNWSTFSKCIFLMILDGVQIFFVWIVMKCWSHYTMTTFASGTNHTNWISLLRIEMNWFSKMSCNISVVPMYFFCCKNFVHKWFQENPFNGKCKWKFASRKVI